MERNLNSFVIEQIQADGIFYFVFNFKGCMKHCRNQKRLWDEANDSTHQASVALYVDLLYSAGDVK